MPADDADDADARRRANIATVASMLECVTRGDKESYLECCAEDVVYEAPYYSEMEPRRGRAALAAMLDNVEQRFSSIDYAVTQVFPAVDPDLVIVEALGDNKVVGSDRRYRNHYLMFVQFRDTLVVEWREFSNPDAFRLAVEG